jgi:hypothetical protein
LVQRGNKTGKTFTVMGGKLYEHLCYQYCH